MYRSITALAAILAVSPLAANAADISYSYLDAGYVRLNPDGPSKDAEGFGLRGSVGVTSNLFMYANYSDVGLRVNGDRYDEKDSAVGIGLAAPLSDGVSLYGKAGYIHAEADVFGSNASDHGYELAAGVRSRIAPNFELEAGVDYTDYDYIGQTTSAVLGARFYLAPNVALGVETAVSDQATVYMAGLRWQWGP